MYGIHDKCISWYIMYVLQYQVLILYGKQHKIVNELLVMKSKELQVEEITYFAKLMLSTVGKLVCRLYVWHIHL